MERHGNVLAGRRPNSAGTFEERFNSFVDRSEGCWLWNGGCFNAGYGEFTFRKKPLYAHRVAYELWVGPIPTDLVIDHTCHNIDPTCPGGKCAHRRCVNPAHLEPVEHQENIRRGLNRTKV